ncbi:MAG: mandelate racemase/muconate lactonizing enzyme family protein [Rhodospirillaceae bacterium]|nr:mandelate racemase/muconate lactonizing enzyme family protein [Rhodospirillaceae bacterium]
MSRIASIEALPLRISPKTIWTFVQVTDADGRTGTGEATLNAREADLVAEVARLKPYLVNRPAEPAPLDVPVPDGGVVEASVSSALDQALWDLKGQREGKPVWQLLGPVQRRRVPLYANINRRTVDRRPEGFAASARHAAAVGFTRFKVAPFDDLTPAIADGEAGRPLIDAGIARVAAVREAAGPEARVMVDCHWRFTETSAERAIDRLAELDVDWFECPVPENATTVAELVRLRKRANDAGMELAGLEMATAPSALLPFLKSGCYDVVMPDIKYIGGFAGMLQAGSLCRRYGAACAPHNPTGPFCHGASLHAAAALDGFDLLEHQYDESSLFDRLVSGRLPEHAGDASDLPSAPGLGFALDAELARELRA